MGDSQYLHLNNSYNNNYIIRKVCCMENKV